jgi:AhpD family alkylhydroperoxidase
MYDRRDSGFGFECAEEVAMARVGYVTMEDASGDAKEVLAGMEERGADVLNLFRTVANSPGVLRNFMRLGSSLLRYGILPPVLRELAILRVAQLTGAEYEWAHHTPIARAAGVSEEQIAALERWAKAPEFDDQQRAILAYVEAATSGVIVPDDVFGAAREHLSEGEIVELTLVCGYWGMVARVLVAAQVDLEPEYIRYLPSST